MNNIYYNIHLILISKYKIFVNLLIILSIYFLFYENKIIYCMNDNSTGLKAPTVAEAKETASHQVQTLKKEITDYAGSQVELLEKIERRDLKILKLKEKVSRLERQVLMWQNEVGELRLQYEERDARLGGYTSDDMDKEPDYQEDPSSYYDNDYYQT